MKDIILMLIIGFLIGAIVASAGFLILGNNGKRDFDASKFRDGNMTPPSGFSGDFNEIDFNNFNPNSFDSSKMPNKPSNE